MFFNGTSAIMPKLIILAVILAVAVFGANAFANALALPKLSENSEQKNIGMEIVTEEQFHELLKQFPNAVELKPEITERKDAKRLAFGTYDYHFWSGERTRWDSWAADDHIRYNFLYYRPFEYTLNYPLYGTGKRITFIDIYMYSNEPRDVSVWMLEGGVGYRYCRFVMRSGPTREFGYQATVYGEN